MLEIMNQVIFQPKTKIGCILNLKASLMEQFEDLKCHKVDMSVQMIKE